MKERESIENRNVTRLTRHIGSTTYHVKIYLPQAVMPNDGMSSLGNESMEDKILRMIQNEVLEKRAQYDTIESPQMSRPPEGSSV